MRVKFLVLFMAISVSLLGQKARIVTKDYTKYRNVEVVGQRNDSLRILVGDAYQTIALSDVRKINFQKDRNIGNEKNHDGLHTSLMLQLYSSRPSRDSRTQEDPALMLDFSYPAWSRWFIGIGGGLQSPHFNTSLVPVYVHAEYTPFSNPGYFMKSRLGKFIPLSPDEFKGGVFSEWTIGHDLPSARRAHMRLLLGYSHQRMVRETPDFWWATDRRTTYRYNRLTFGFGLIF